MGEERTAAAILTKVAGLVSGDREKTHGDKVQNHHNIAGAWNWYLDGHEGPLTPLDAALMMVLLKVARTKLGAYNADDYDDMAGYSAVAAEIAARGQGDGTT